MNEFIEAHIALIWQDLRSSYDVVIVGGGGHGLSTAYHLATRHGITNVAVLERGYIGSGNSGRNTTAQRAEDLRQLVEQAVPGVQVDLVYGGQPHYDYLASVE
jgi:glycine/D-amino acid oxidase-like deaminating enzyme